LETAKTREVMQKIRRKRSADFLFHPAHTGAEPLQEHIKLSHFSSDIGFRQFLFWSCEHRPRWGKLDQLSQPEQAR
jgi:hypothetical protein